MRDCRLGGEYRPDRRVHRGALTRGGSDHPGQDGHDAFRLDRPAGDSQPMEPGAHTGRLVQRLGGGRGVRNVPGRPGHADRRFHHATCGVLRRGRNETDIRVHRRPGHLSAGPYPRSPRVHRPCGGRSAADLRGVPPARPARRTGCPVGARRRGPASPVPTATGSSTASPRPKWQPH